MKNSFFLFIFLFFGNFLIQAQEVNWDQTPFTTSNLSKLNRGARTTVVISKQVIVEGTVKVPKNVSLKFSEKGKLRIKNEATKLIIEGPILTGRQQIFDVSARGVTSYRFESVSNIQFQNQKTYYPEWWGVFPNIIPGKKGEPGSKARHHTFLKEMMLDIGASGGGEIVFDGGVYYIRDIIIDSDNITVRGQGKNTILRFDRDNYTYSTRRGGLFVIQGATLEKFYSDEVPEGLPLAGNYLYTTEQKTIENIIVKDLAIEWNEEATSDDPSMNGLTIMNSRNVVIDNVHVNMFGANRAFYVGSGFDGDITENIVITNSSCVNSRTGVFIFHGYKVDNPIREKLSLGNVLVENNHFKLVGIPDTDVKNVHVTEAYLDHYGTGIFFIGNEFTQNTNKKGTEVSRSMGSFVIKNNIIENADFGIRCWYPSKDEARDYVHQVSIEGNTFINFNYIGIFSTFKEIEIKNNTFRSKQLSLLPLSVKESNPEDFVASAIQIAKAPFKRYRTKMGPENVTIESNTIEGCYLGATPIVLQPKKEGVIRLANNTFKYDASCKKPDNDIRIITNQRKFRSKRATLVLKENKGITSNDSSLPVSIDIDSKRDKHITVIKD